MITFDVFQAEVVLFRLCTECFFYVLLQPQSLKAHIVSIKTIERLTIFSANLNQPRLKIQLQECGMAAYIFWIQQKIEKVLEIVKNVLNMKFGSPGLSSNLDAMTISFLYPLLSPTLLYFSFVDIRWLSWFFFFSQWLWWKFLQFISNIIIFRIFFLIWTWKTTWKFNQNAG